MGVTFAVGKRASGLKYSVVTILLLSFENLEGKSLVTCEKVSIFAMVFTSHKTLVLRSELTVLDVVNKY